MRAFMLIGSEQFAVEEVSAPTAGPGRQILVLPICHNVAYRTTDLEDQ